MARPYALIAPAFAAALALGAWTGGAGMERLVGTDGGEGAGEAAFRSVDLPDFIVTLDTTGEAVHALASLSVEVREDAVADPAGRDRLQEAVLIAAADALSRPGADDDEVVSLIAAETDERLGGSVVANLHVRKITVFAPARTK